MEKTIDLTIKNINEKYNKYDLCIVMPVYNESENIEKVLNDWNEELKKNVNNFCFVVVNDGSRDNSLKIIESLNLNIFLLDKHNSGHGRSTRLGYDFSVNVLDADYVLQIDSDGQCEPKYFIDFWSKRLDYDFVLGVRKTRGDGLSRMITSKVSKIITSLLTKVKMEDPNTPYRLFNKNTLKKSLKLVNESFDIHNIALTYVILKNQYKYSTVEIDFPNRIGGDNSINLLKVFQMGINMLFDLYFLKNKLK